MKIAHPSPPTSVRATPLLVEPTKPIDARPRTIRLMFRATRANVELKRRPYRGRRTAGLGEACAAGRFFPNAATVPVAESGRFAHFLEGYKEAGGFSELSRLALGKADEARATGVWRGSAWELWLCLFFAHRAARHTGSDPGHGDALCEALRHALQELRPFDAQRLAARFTPTRFCPAESTSTRAIHRTLARFK